MGAPWGSLRAQSVGLRVRGTFDGLHELPWGFRVHEFGFEVEGGMY